MNPKSRPATMERRRPRNGLSLELRDRAMANAICR
jgi:hypothetical protein